MEFKGVGVCFVLDTFWIQQKYLICHLSRNVGK